MSERNGGEKCCRCGQLTRHSREVEGNSLSDHTYRIIEIVGTSPEGTDAAIPYAIARAAQTTRGLDWFEVPTRVAESCRTSLR